MGANTSARQSLKQTDQCVCYLAANEQSAIMVHHDAIKITPLYGGAQASRGEGRYVLASAVKHLRAVIRVDKDFASSVHANASGCDAVSGCREYAGAGE
jgi:hypothetical protein